MASGESIVRSYAAAFNVGDLDRVVSCFAPHARIHGALGEGGLDFAVPIWRSLIEGLGMQLKIEALVESGSQVAVRFRETGRFDGPFVGLPGHEPNGRCYELLAMEWFEVADGLIVRRWGARDAATMTKQLVG